MSLGRYLCSKDSRGFAASMGPQVETEAEKSARFYQLIALGGSY